MSTIYRQQILEYGTKPLNFEELTGANLVGSADNELCGDHIKVYAQLAGEKIERLTFMGEGCMVMKAYASLLTQEAVGKTPEELRQQAPEAVLALIDIELTPTRTRCALLAHEAAGNLVQKGADI